MTWSIKTSDWQHFIAASPFSLHQDFVALIKKYSDNSYQNCTVINVDVVILRLEGSFVCMHMKIYAPEEVTSWLEEALVPVPLQTGRGFNLDHQLIFLLFFSTPYGLKILI